jgi:hypothetical protein
MSGSLLSEAGQVILSEAGSPILSEGNSAIVGPNPVGSQADMANRIQAVQPTGWFSSSQTPILSGLLAGLGSIWSSLWNLLTYVSAQTRISTATDINLDIISSDFLGTSLPRRSGETDASFRTRIKANIFQPMATRAAVSRALTALTGAAPTIFEPRNANDTGGWGKAGAVVNTGLAYGYAGGYGSYKLPFQAFIATALPQVTGTIGVQGYGSAATPFANVIGAYGSGAIEYDSGAAVLLATSDDEIYSTVNAVKPVGTILWITTEATNPNRQQSGTAVLDTSFILDVSELS